MSIPDPIDALGWADIIRDLVRFWRVSLCVFIFVIIALMIPTEWPKWAIIALGFALGVGWELYRRNKSISKE